MKRNRTPSLNNKGGLAPKEKQALIRRDGVPRINDEQPDHLILKTQSKEDWIWKCHHSPKYQAMEYKNIERLYGEIQ